MWRNKSLKNKASAILRTLEREFSIPKLSSLCKDPFKTLIRTIISQATADVNTARAYKELEGRVGITVLSLSRVSREAIEESLRSAGLYRNKSKVMKELASVILERYGGSLDFIYGDSLGEARRKLLELPGVGPKTADILLLFCARKPTIPVDTHVNRVSKRLGLVSDRADYEKVRRALQSLYPSEEYLKVHFLLIYHGRRYCKARRPLCPSCPVRDKCSDSSKTTFYTPK